MNPRELWKWLKAEFRWRILGKRYKIIQSEEFQRKLERKMPEL